MRVTGGKFGGRRLCSPRSGVRPTQDRVREALFSFLGERVCGCRFMDLFAGSGAVGIEAWSRGAAAVWWVEADRRICGVLRENVRLLGSGEQDGAETRVICADALRFLRSAGCAGAGAFDLVFADPPYDPRGCHRWCGRLQEALSPPGVLAAGAWLVMEQGAREAAEAVGGWALSRERVYGDTVLRVFHR